MKKQILFILLISLTSSAFAQIHEIGGFLGGSNFIGDIGRTNYVFPNSFSGGLVYKYNLNPRISLRANYTYVGVKADDKYSDNPYRAQRVFRFSNSIHEFSIGTEFNFFEYNIRNYNTTYTPYITANLGMFTYKIPESSADSELTFRNKLSYSIPIGLGFKGRINDNFAFALESTVHFTFIDNIDYIDSSAYNSNLNLNFGGSGNDIYVFTGISLVYTFGRPTCFADEMR